MTMLPTVQKAYDDVLFMLEDFLRKVPDDKWYTGCDEYLIPVRITYHMLASFEWLTTKLPFEEHLKARRFGMNWQGPVEGMPSREEVLAAIPWLRELVAGWIADWAKYEPGSEEYRVHLEDALYWMRHIQHHMGELSVLSRLLQFDAPEWR
jgi:hypothetical protein